MKRGDKEYMRIKLVIFLLIIILGIAGYGYYRYKGVISIEQKAQGVLSEIQTLREQNNRYKGISEAITAENNRCQVFITQKEGDFSSFEYCKKFIQWAKNLVVE